MPAAQGSCLHLHVLILLGLRLQVGKTQLNSCPRFDFDPMIDQWVLRRKQRRHLSSTLML